MGGPPWKIRWPCPSRRSVSTTTRIGEGPGQCRVVSCGSSACTVPAPTITASHSARSRWVCRMSRGPLIQNECPCTVAIRPSRVWAMRPSTNPPPPAPARSNGAYKSPRSANVASWRSNACHRSSSVCAAGRGEVIRMTPRLSRRDARRHLNILFFRISPAGGFTSLPLGAGASHGYKPRRAPRRISVMAEIPSKHCRTVANDGHVAAGLPPLQR